jgi:hypothetical protein
MLSELNISNMITPKVILNQAIQRLKANSLMEKYINERIKAIL